MKPGSYTGGVIILLSDGRRTTGPDPLDIAKMTADRGVRVYTVGFGTREGASIEFEGYSFYVRLDEETLKAIARMTGGEYFHAGTAADLHKVYETLNARIAMETRETEIGALLRRRRGRPAAVGGAALAAVVPPRRADAGCALNSGPSITRQFGGIMHGPVSARCGAALTWSARRGEPCRRPEAADAGCRRARRAGGCGGSRSTRFRHSPAARRIAAGSSVGAAIVWSRVTVLKSSKRNLMPIVRPT